MCLMLDQFLWGHSSRDCDISCLIGKGPIFGPKSGLGKPLRHNIFLRLMFADVVSYKWMLGLHVYGLNLIAYDFLL